MTHLKVCEAHIWCLTRSTQNTTLDIMNREKHVLFRIDCLERLKSLETETRM